MTIHNELFSASVKKLHSNCSIFLQASKTLTISKFPIKNQYNILLISKVLSCFKTPSATAAVIGWWFRSSVVHCRVWARVHEASGLSVWRSTRSVFDGLFQGPIHNACGQCEHHLLIYLIYYVQTKVYEKSGLPNQNWARVVLGWGFMYRINKDYLNYIFRKQKYGTSKFPCNANDVGCIHFLLLFYSIRSLETHE